MQVHTQVKFAGKIPNAKRIKQFKNDEMMRVKNTQSGKKLSRKERIAAYRAKKAQEARNQASVYKAALEQYLQDPTPLHNYLNSPVYTDQEGDFTVGELLATMQASEKRDDRINVGLITACSILVVPLVAAYVANFIQKGHENIFKNQGTNINEFVSRFAHSVQDNIRDTIKKMEARGLIRTNYDDFGTYFQMTDLGKRLSKLPKPH